MKAEARLKGGEGVVVIINKPLQPLRPVIRCQNRRIRRHEGRPTPSTCFIFHKSMIIKQDDDPD
ncbi:MAG: hypothetical protein LUQ54_01650 [Methanoregula sp.]|nr:hypothetical protein [Methanoregula sp.]